MRCILVGLLMTFSLSSMAYSPGEREQIRERIKPIGQVRLERQSANGAGLPNVKAGEEQSRELPGQATYERYCSICHRDGLAAAPKFRDGADWQPRLDKKTLEELLASALSGLNAMPAKGTCLDCSEKEIKDAIEFMLPKS